MRTVKAYACEFRCGARVNTSRAGMAKHEATCKRNPDRRACPTCGYEMVRPEEDENGRTYNAYACHLDLVPDGKQMIVGCPSWILDQGVHVED